MVERAHLDHQVQPEENKYNMSLSSNARIFMIFFIQLDIYETYEDLMRSCNDTEVPPTTGCLAFVRNTRFIYVQMPGEDCDWEPWVSILLY